MKGLLCFSLYIKICWNILLIFMRQIGLTEDLSLATCVHRVLRRPGLPWVEDHEKACATRAVRRYTSVLILLMSPPSLWDVVFQMGTTWVLQGQGIRWMAVKMSRPRGLLWWTSLSAVSTDPNKSLVHRFQFILSGFVIYSVLYKKNLHRDIEMLFVPAHKCCTLNFLSFWKEHHQLCWCIHSGCHIR